MEGYIKLHRKILESEVFANPTALKIWIWCLAKATFKERYIPVKTGRGETTVKLNPGQFLFGRFKAEEELNIDGSTIYKWMQKFASEEYGMLKIESSSHYSIITLCNWESYNTLDDDKEQPSNNQVTSKEQPSNNQVTQTRKIKNVKNVKNDLYIEPNFEKFKKFTNIPPGLEEVKERMEQRGLTTFTAEAFLAHYEANGWMVGKTKMKNWDAALTTWNEQSKQYKLNNNSNGNNKESYRDPFKYVNDAWKD